MVRALAALVIGAAGGTVLSTGAAFAAACPAGTGVTVVVNSSASCDVNGGSPASSNFSDAGHSLNSARGFVCDVDGYPSKSACRGTAPANAYWGLFWADGKGGGWTYSSTGAYSLRVPKGGWVAFVFQNSSSKRFPGVTPYTAPPAPKPKPKPKPPVATKPKPKPAATTKTTAKAKATAKGTAAPKPSAKAQGQATPAGKAPSASPSASASAKAAAREEVVKRTSQQTQSQPSSTLWVGVLLALALVVGMGVTIWQRRARRS